jgi:hypothetical protein
VPAGLENWKNGKERRKIWSVLKSQSLKNSLKSKLVMKNTLSLSHVIKKPTLKQNENRKKLCADR